MDTTNAVQVSTQKEETQVAFIQSVVAFLQDATNLPKLRQEVEGLRAEVETLKRQLGDAQAEVSLEREAHGNTLRERDRLTDDSHRLTSRLSSLQHKFDTINGVVMAAMAEIERDKPKTETVIHNPTQGDTPWNPSSPLRSVS